MVVMPRSLTRSVEPTAEPVSVATLKTALNIFTNDYDGRLFNLIKAAREAVEAYTGRALMTQTWVLKLDRFPHDEITLPYPPLQSVTTLKYVDTDGDTQTWDSGNYVVDTAREPGVVRRAYDVSYPDKRCDEDTVEVTYVAGYSSEDDVPEAAKQAIILHVKSAFDDCHVCDSFFRLIEHLRYC